MKLQFQLAAEQSPCPSLPTMVSFPDQSALQSIIAITQLQTGRIEIMTAADENIELNKRHTLSQVLEQLKKAGVELTEAGTISENDSPDRKGTFFINMKEYSHQHHDGNHVWLHLRLNKNQTRILISSTTPTLNDNTIRLTYTADENYKTQKKPCYIIPTQSITGWGYTSDTTLFISLANNGCYECVHVDFTAGNKDTLEQALGEASEDHRIQTKPATSTP